MRDTLPAGRVQRRLAAVLVEPWPLLLMLPDGSLRSRRPSEPTITLALPRQLDASSFVW